MFVRSGRISRRRYTSANESSRSSGWHEASSKPHSPRRCPTLEGWQISPLYRPAREVGGDFYDFHFLSEDRLGLVIGDATGKGVSAALVMSTTCGMLQLAAQVLGSSSPGEVSLRVNETLLARIPSNTFVTCFYAILDPKSGQLVYANAGHDPPYCAPWWRSSRN